LLTFQSESRSAYSISTIQVNLVPSSEVDIIPQAGLASLIEQMDQSSAFCHSCSPANQNNDAAMGLRLSSARKSSRLHVMRTALAWHASGEHLLIPSFFWQHFAQAGYAVAERQEGMGNILWHIMVQKKRHGPGGAICLATSKSISPR